MDFKLVLLFLALYSADAKKYAKQEKKTLFHNSRDCVKIKCPYIDKPVCVKLVHKDGGNETAPIYVLMINKCEMKYAKCLKVLNTKIVPIENCYHNGTQKAENKRVKRQIQASQQIRTTKNVKLGKPIRFVRTNQTIKNKQIAVHGDANKTHVIKLKMLQKKKKKDGGEYFYETNNYDGEIEEGQEREANEYEQYEEEDKPEDAEVANVEGDDANVEGEDANVEGEDANVEGEDANVEGEDANVEGEDSKVDGEDGKVDKEHLEGDSEVDSAQYNADCPTVCPSLGVMVCARNQHGVYRTFLSSCHMRMVMCRSSKEVLELVSRLPCMMTASYLSEKWLQPKGHIPGEVDEVLRFILCREMTQQSREDDPRCEGIDIEQPVSDISQNEDRNIDHENY